jgi:hypothetical protein
MHPSIQAFKIFPFEQTVTFSRSMMSTNISFFNVEEPVEANASPTIPGIFILPGIVNPAIVVGED